MAEDIAQSEHGSGPASRVKNARHAWRDRIAAADLPLDVKALIAGTVRRTRLWRREKIEVADELLAHFGDALASGETSDAATAGFGDPILAAKLIRRAKKRNRSIFYHAIKWELAAVGLLAVWYAALAVVFYAGRPTIKIDYIAQLNEAALRVPEPDRAWPMYQRAMGVLTASDPQWQEDVRKSLPTTDNRGNPASIEKLLNTDALQLVRDATRRRRIGFIIDQTENSSEFPPAVGVAASHSVLDTSLTSTDHNHLIEVYWLSRLLQADAERAVHGDQPGRAADDLQAMIAMAAQLKEEPRLFTQMTGVEVLSECINCLEGILLNHPSALSDADLVQIATGLAKPRVGADLLHFSGLRMEHADLLQRLFTDDGNGDGYPTPDGLPALREAYKIQGRQQSWLRWLGPPAQLLVAPSRAQMANLLETNLREIEAALARPLRESPRFSPTLLRQAYQQSSADEVRYELLTFLMINVPDFPRGAEFYLGRRDGALIAIALERYRRKNGDYPSALDALRPEFMAEIPVDRIDGQPLKYKLVDGHPLIYSVGADRTDNDGWIAHRNDPTGAASWDKAATGVSGDWLLYPTNNFAGH